MSVSSSYGSLDVGFTFTPATGLSILVETDALVIPAYGGYLTDEKLPAGIRITTKEEDGYLFLVCSTEVGGTEVDKSDYSLGVSMDMSIDIRIYLSNAHVSVYANERWAYVFGFKGTEYPEIVTATISIHGASATLTNIWKSEIPDEREAVYVDYEASAMSAIQAIIQQRPLEIFPMVGRSLGFTYISIGDTVPGVRVNGYTETITSPTDMASDGLVQGIDVGISTSALTAEEVGLITRLFRLSELFTGSFRAANIIQRKAIQRRNMLQLTTRLDPRIQVRDLIEVSLTATGTGRVIDDEVIVENIRFNIEDGNYSMNLDCRRNKNA